MDEKTFNMTEKLVDLFGEIIEPSLYIERIWQPPFRWQREVLDPLHKRIILNCARQSGKSTIVSGLGLQTVKHKMNSLALIVAPSEKQSKETMLKVEDFISRDDDLARNEIKGDSAFEKRFKNGSRIVALPGTEKSVRGYSNPDLIIVDEASRVLDATYKALRPMLTGNPNAKLILLSTPWTTDGFFYNEWVKNPNWHKVYVVPKWTLDPVTNTLIERPSEEEFRQIYKEKGISAYYSPRHTLEFLYEELASLGPIWFRREYGGEFIEGAESIFTMDMIEGMFDDSIGVKYDESDEYFEDDIKSYGFLEGIFDDG